MQYWVVIDPSLLATDDFVTLWNEDDQCAALAQAEPGREAAFAVEGAVGAYLRGVAETVDASNLFDLIKMLLRKAGATEPMEHVEADNPDGSKTIVVRRTGA
jgi:hypothetical protein